MTRLKLIVAAMLAMLIALPANAAVLLFTLTGPGGNVYTWELDSDPVPNLVNNTVPRFFVINGVTITVNGGASGNRRLIFANAGGFEIWQGLNPQLILTGGANPRLFTGTVGNPSFATGSYSLGGGPSNNPGVWGLTIFAVPESSTWAMMILGFGAAGFVLRRQRDRERGPAIA